MDDDLRVVFDSRNRQSCRDRALVLSSLDIPYEIVDDGISSALVVPAEFSARASRELALYDEENPPPRPAKPLPRAEPHDPMPGLIGYVLIVCLVAGMAGFSFFGEDWRAAGRIDGELVRNGELWRLVTALTLHSGLKHLLSNLVFGLFFGTVAGRLLGSGYAWLVIVLAAATGNGINTLLLDPSHRAIGASTAVFAALGLIAGYVWRGKLMSQRHDRWSTRWGPVVGGLALLMYTGAGAIDPETGLLDNTDVGAHLLGFVCGFASGVLLTRLHPLRTDARLQARAGTIAAGLVVGCWAIALNA